MKIVADENIPHVVECFSSIGQVEAVSGRKITPKAVADADILLVRSVTQVGQDLLADSKVKFVATATIGFDHVDVDFLRRRNIGFASAPGSNANSAAEYVVAALLEVGQRHNITLEGKSIGVVGVGNVGSRVAKKCTALGMKVKLNDPPLRRQSGDPKYLPMDELFDCDFITLHTPLTFEGIDGTFHLADERFFKSLKTGGVFINASRGGVVDSTALQLAIKAGRLTAVVLDVWENEPNIDVELMEMVDIATPHIAGYSLDGKIAGMIMIYRDACEYFGLQLKYEIGDFLPEPAVRQLTISPRGKPEQQVLHQAVNEIYRITADDRKLRHILEEKAEQKGAFFDGLRKNYPVRREFQNTGVLIATEGTEEKENVDSRLRGNDRAKVKTIVRKLAGIGFKVADEQK
jgi:erythronate-4-phosphate dehydrogenase